VIRTRKQPETGGTLGVACDASGQAALVLAWFGLRAEDRGTAAVVLHGLRYPAARIVAARCRCGIAVAEDHVADAVFVMLYRIRRVPRLRIPATTTLAYLCGVARNEWRWDRWRRARESEAAVELAAAASSQRAARRRSTMMPLLSAYQWSSSRHVCEDAGPIVARIRAADLVVREYRGPDMYDADEVAPVEQEGERAGRRSL